LEDSIGGFGAEGGWLVCGVVANLVEFYLEAVFFEILCRGKVRYPTESFLVERVLGPGFISQKGRRMLRSEYMSLRNGHGELGTRKLCVDTWARKSAATHWCWLGC